MWEVLSLPWQAVRAAWAVSMTDIEEGRLSWADSTQWSLNRISNSQLAVFNSQNVLTSGQKIKYVDLSMRVPVQMRDTMDRTSISVLTVTSRDVLRCTQNPGASHAARIIPRIRRHQYPKRASVDHYSTPLTSWLGGGGSKLIYLKR